MPNGPQGLDFEPQDQSQEPPKKIPWRRVYGVDEETLPLITGDKKPDDSDRYGNREGMGGPGKNGQRDDTGVPEGTFPKPGEVFADDVDKNPSTYRVGTESKSERQAREIQEVIAGRSKIKPSEPWLAGIGGALTIPVANIGGPKLVDVVTRRAAQESSSVPNWARRGAQWAQTAYVPERMTSVEELLFGNNKVHEINNQADDALRSVKKVLKGGELAAAEEKSLKGMKSVLKTSLADDALYSADIAGQQLARARSLNFGKTKVATTIGDDVVKVAGDDVLRIMTERSDIITKAQKDAHRLGATSKLGQPKGTQMWNAAKLTGFSIVASMADDGVRSGVNSLLTFNQPQRRDSNGRLLPKENAIVMGDDKSGLSNMLIPMAIATHAKGSKGRTMLAVGGASLLGMGVDHIADKTGLNDWAPDSWKRTGIFDGIGLGAGFAVPVKNWKVRVGTVAAGFVAGNLLESSLSSTARGDINPDINRALKETGEIKTDRSLDSLNEALAAWNTVGSRSISAEGVAFQQFRAKDAYSKNNSPEKWNSLSPGDQLNNRRELAILSRTLGEVRLNGGTKVSYSSSEAKYKLQGMGVDIGGYALEKLLVSQSFTGDAIKLTRQLDGQEVSGKTVNAENEVRALQEFSQETQQRIDQITGVSPAEAAERRAKGIDTNEEFTKPRNMQAIIDQLEHEYKHGTGIDVFYKQILNDTQYRVGAFLPLRTSEGGRKLVAKLLRDEATIKMSMAQYKMNSNDGNAAILLLQGTAQDRDLPFRVPQVPGRERQRDIRDSNGDLMRKGYTGAVGALELAEALDPDNPELKILKDMRAHMLEHAYDVRDKQMKDPVYNPLQVDKRVFRTKDPTYRE